MSAADLDQQYADSTNLGTVLKPMEMLPNYCAYSPDHEEDEIDKNKALDNIFKLCKTSAKQWHLELPTTLHRQGYL
ncbi:hypothetical protein CGMCC3_g18094 [Colletotrichum fructicola]|nr:uncharacterized protein CGMCC3_g18094 [Colletotrichum fructicola]KAE9565724.1 hypothetical protein CGMCC3_g18094 [Colletotrichum fructicola]